MSNAKRLSRLLATTLLVSALFGCTPTPSAPESASESPVSAAPDAPAAEAADTDGGDAGDYPTKPVQLIVPVKPGGDTDTNARIFAKYVSQELGQNVVVVNTEGGAGATGTKAAMDAAPDGYNVLFFHTESLLPKLSGMVDYDLFDLKIGGIALMDNTTVLATHKDSGFATMDEFVEQAKAAPGEKQFGMATGGYPHLIGLAVQNTAEIEMNIVDVGGNADKTTSLLGHKIDLINTQYGLTQDYFENGDFVCLGLLSDERNPMLPDIPTLKEQGYDLVFNKSFFTAMPKDTPDAVRDVFAAAMERACQNPEYIAEMEQYFIQVEYLDAPAATAYWSDVKSGFEQYGDELKASVQ